MSFVHLHTHTEYSLLDGFSNIPKLVQRAKDLEMPALAITDHGTMFGVIDFYNQAKEVGIKPIIGLESYMAARTMKDKDGQLDRKSTHLLLLAENQKGYENLLKIASASQLDGYYYYPRIDHEFLADHAEGLIATSGCLAAEIPRAILEDNAEKAQRKMDWYYEVFGRDNFFVELQGHNIDDLHRMNKGLIEMGKRYNSNFVVTNDVHYINEEDAKLQDILLCVQTGNLISEPNRMRMDGSSYYLKPAHEMAAMFPEFPEAVSNTLLIAERCEVDLDPKGYHLPEFTVPEGKTDQSYLRELCEQGLKEKCPENYTDPVYLERLEYELDIIHTMGFDAYFLIVWDICRESNELGIWYNARGSAAGSIVAYTLNITLVDPIYHGLIFERFLNPGRVSMPDIDLDFQDDKRHLLMHYCAEKYGEDKVAAIITFNKMKARAAVRDVGRVMDIPLNEVDRIAKMIPATPGNPVSIEKALETIPELQASYNQASYVRNLIDTAVGMENVVRGAGTHAAGVVVTDRPVLDYVPLHRPTGNSGDDTPIKTVTQFDMGTVDSLGLLKVDFLGLSTLTIMQRACAIIKKRHGIDFNLINIPLDDPETYETLGRGETAGVFQLEGGGMRRWVMAMKPKTLAHVIAMVALYRPGPMDFIPDYIARMNGEQEITYLDPQLEPILKETYGITVYQEQIMYTAMNLGGYTASEADFLRKTVAKKKEAALLKQRDKFVAGAVERNVDKDAANEIFNNWEAFARYGFPKGHAADYAVIAVETAYLKTHYPVEYMTALLSVSKSDSGKVVNYVTDCNRMGIEVLPPDICSSGWDFEIEDREDGCHAIRFGLGAVKNVGHHPVEEIIEARKEEPFSSVEKFIRQADLRKVGKRALDSLIKAGALDCFGSRIALLNVLEPMVSMSSAHFQAEEIGQLSFFGGQQGFEEKLNLPEVELTEWDRREQLNWERDLIGMYVSDHPLTPILEKMRVVTTHFSSELPDAAEGDKVRIAGLVAKVRYHQTKKGQEMAFVTLEDTQGMMDVVMFPRSWQKYRELLQFDAVVIIEGKANSREGKVSVLGDVVKTQHQVVTSLESGDKRGSFGGNGNGHQSPPQRAAKPAQQNPRPPAGQTTPSNTAKTAPPPTAAPLAQEQALKKAETSPVTNPAKSDFAEPESIPAAEKTQPETRKSEPASKPKTSHADEPDDFDMDGLPPPPEAFPMGWGEEELLLEKPGSKPAPPQVKEDKPPYHPPDAAAPVLMDAPAPEEADSQKETEREGVLLNPKIESEAKDFVKPEAVEEGDGEVMMIRIILRTNGDKAREKLKLRRIHGELIRCPGKDRFSFYIIENGQAILLDFPNFTTKLSDELKAKLIQIAGEENIAIEPLTY